jgi:hypothetical protein
MGVRGGIGLDGERCNINRVCDLMTHDAHDECGWFHVPTLHFPPWVRSKGQWREVYEWCQGARVKCTLKVEVATLCGVGD